MDKNKTSKAIEKTDCPECGHHKAWALPDDRVRCTKCRFEFTPQQRQGMGLFARLRKRQ